MSLSLNPVTPGGLTINPVNPGTLTAITTTIATGARGDGITDDTAPIQAAIDAAAAQGGGIVFLPKGKYLVTGLTLKGGVKLTSLAQHYGYAGGGETYVVKILCNTAAATVIDTPTSTTYTPSVEGISIDGGGVASIGIRYRNTQWGAVKNVHLNNFADQGLLVDGGNTGSFEGILAVNCLQNQSRAAKAGAVQVAGADHYLSRIEATASVTGVTSSNLYCCAFVITQANGFHIGLLGEISDVGFHIAGGFNRFTNCRADLNYGHGWEIVDGAFTPSKNIFGMCHAVSNGRGATNTYDAFNIAATGNSFCACRTVTTGTGSSQRYGFNDTVAQAPVLNRNSYDFGCGGDAVTAAFNTQPSSGSGVPMPPHDIHPANGSTTLDATGTSLIVCDLYTGAATVTDILGGVQGQTVNIFGNANVTLAVTGNIRTNTGSSKTLAANKIYRYMLVNGHWYEDA